MWTSITDKQLDRQTDKQTNTHKIKQIIQNNITA